MTGQPANAKFLMMMWIVQYRTYDVDVPQPWGPNGARGPRQDFQHILDLGHPTLTYPRDNNTPLTFQLRGNCWIGCQTCNSQVRRMREDEDNRWYVVRGVLGLLSLRGRGFGWDLRMRYSLWSVVRYWAFVNFGVINFVISILRVVTHEMELQWYVNTVQG